MNIQPLSFTEVTNLRNVVDALGDARAELDAAKQRVAFLEGLLKNERVAALNGDRYRVAISYDVVTKRVDWKAVAEKLEPSRQLVRAHTKQTTADRVRVSALGK